MVSSRDAALLKGPKTPLMNSFYSIVQHCLHALRCPQWNLYLRFHQESYVNSEYDCYRPWQRFWRSLENIPGTGWCIWWIKNCQRSSLLMIFWPFALLNKQKIKEEVEYVTWLPYQGQGFLWQDSAGRYCHDEFMRLLLWYQPRWRLIMLKVFCHTMTLTMTLLSSHII